MTKTCFFFLFGLAIAAPAAAQPGGADPLSTNPPRSKNTMTKTIALLWKAGPVAGQIEVTNGTLAQVRIASGKGEVSGARFSLTSRGPCRLEIAVADARLQPGANPTLVTVREKTHPFSFFLRDVTPAFPVFLPSCGVAVTTADDTRTCRQVEQALRQRKLRTGLQQIAREPEESYDKAAARTRNLKGPIWLGLSRDMRIFQVDVNWTHGSWGSIQPRFHNTPSRPPETNGAPLLLQFILGRGSGCQVDITRRLEDGVLPILHGTARDGDIAYHITAFVANERTPLTPDTLRGTHFLVADGNAFAHTFTEEQQKQFEALSPAELNRDEETVLYFRAKAVNTAPVPRYAWFKLPGFEWGVRAPRRYDGARGLSIFDSGRVFCLSKLNGNPAPQEELALLLPPAGSAVLEFFVPHSPISQERAEALANVDFDQRHAECRAFWKTKLATAAQVHLPESRLEEMTRAGLLHLDLVAYGLEPDGTVAPTIGVYPPIGTESAPIITFFDSMGWPDLARRSLQFFLDLQREDGAMLNCGGYTSETAAALWTIGEHFRYTRDQAWVRQIAPKLVKACDYLIAWRRRNQKEELRGKGYGLIEGKVADPPDPCRYFMNSAYACAGLARAAEMLADLDPAKSQELAAEAQAFKRDIRTALAESLAKSPALPLGDGTWCPTTAPYPEYRGPLSLYAEGGYNCWDSFPLRDSLTGPLWLIFTGVLDPGEPMAEALLDFHQELFTLRNVAFAQPYYSRHDYAHLRRGEVKPFLKTYYNAFSSLADRETYSFWECYSFGSPHKTHEEAWFLMQTRWMLYLEDGDTLKLLSGIPRAWMQDGSRLELSNAASYFGPLSLHVESKLAQGEITARVDCASNRQPKRVEFRLPHPKGRKPREIIGGTYDSRSETVRIENFTGRADITLRF
jgi:hypothetical protein